MSWLDFYGQIEKTCLSRFMQCLLTQNSKLLFKENNSKFLFKDVNSNPQVNKNS